ncbi:MAG TPA: energy transducer TonB [Acidobacteriaceae bacterium]|nr:energy transducer TonB [Acidobacteriaceae bacterium]
MYRILVASLLSTFALTAAAATPKPVSEASGAAAPTAVVVSTGVTEAQLLHATAIDIPSDALATIDNPAKLILRVNLDQTGTPTHVQVVRSINPEVDGRVMKAVQNFRWRPAVLDNQTIPVAVNLVVQVQH